MWLTKRTYISGALFWSVYPTEEDARKYGTTAASGKLAEARLFKVEVPL